MRRTLTCILPLAGFLISIQFANAENWPQWHGPNNTLVSTETGLPAKWSKTENVAWRLPMPGPAGSTPIVWDKRVFLTSADDSKLVLMCISTDGHTIWKTVVTTGNQAIRSDEGNLASASPSTDGKHVWVYFGTGDLACYDFAGYKIWKFNLQDRYGKFRIMWGMHVTPLLDGDRLYLSIIQSGGSKVAAIDKNTGQEIWQQPRPSDAHSESEQSYASPIVYRDGQQEYLLTLGADYIVAHSLEDGHELWRCGGLNPKSRYNNSLRIIASPVAVPGLIVVPSAKNGPVLGLSPANEGDITSSESGHVWTKPNGTPDVPSPLVYDGLVYLCRENGVLTCIDAKTGQEYYQQRIHDYRHRASPLYADGKIYIAARDGFVAVVKAGKEYQPIATIEMHEGICSSPIVSGGTLYLRTFDALYAIREGAKVE